MPPGGLDSLELHRGYDKTSLHDVVLKQVWVERDRLKDLCAPVGPGDGRHLTEYPPRECEQTRLALSLPCTQPEHRIDERRKSA
ncbi:MAG: hypothetical protein JWR13_1761, partial [Mycobacterium sp.]|nr:hypothetical protein [Mycobacterium sp.]